MTTRRSKRSLVAVTVGLSLALTACGSGDDGGDSGANAALKAQVAYAAEKNPVNFNVLTGAGNVFDTQVIVNGIWPTAFVQKPDFSVEVNDELLESAEQTSESPQTIVYKIKEEAVWSDDTPISADDFIYIYEHLNGKNTEYDVAATAGYDVVESVKGSDGGKTVTVVFTEVYPDWKGLFSTLLPAHYMKTLGEDVQAWNEGLTGEKTKGISGGPYVMSDYKSDQTVTLTRNEKYYGTEPEVESLVFRIITDSTQTPTALKNNDVQMIYPQPQVDLVDQVEAIEGVTTDIGFGPIFEHFDFNLANAALKELPLRKALFTAVDREQIIGAGVGQFSPESKPLDNRMLVEGQPGYQDNVTSEKLGGGDVEGAKKILTDAGYTGVGSALVDPQGKPVPPLRMRYTEGNKIREDQCNLFAATAKELGVTVEVSSTADLGATLDERDFDVIVFAWVGTPFPYSANRDIYVTDGGSNYNGYSNKVVDDALNKAAKSLDEEEAQKLLNEADLQVSKDAITLPLYQKPTFLAYRNGLENVENNSTTVGVTWNVQDWTVSAS